MVGRRELPDCVRESIPIALGMLLRRTDRDDIDKLGAIAKGYKKYPAVRHFAVMALARVGGDQCRDIVVEILRRNIFNTAEDRAFAWLALGMLGGEAHLMAEYERKAAARRALRDCGGRWGSHGTSRR